MESRRTSAKNLSALVLGPQGIFLVIESRLDALTERLLRQFDGIFDDYFLGIAIAWRAAASRPVPRGMAVGGSAVDGWRKLSFLELPNVFPARRGSRLLCGFEWARRDAPLRHDLPLALDIRSQGFEG